MSAEGIPLPPPAGEPVHSQPPGQDARAAEELAYLDGIFGPNRKASEENKSTIITGHGRVTIEDDAARRLDDELNRVFRG